MNNILMTAGQFARDFTFSFPEGTMLVMVGFLMALLISLRLERFQGTLITHYRECIDRRDALIRAQKLVIAEGRKRIAEQRRRLWEMEA